MTWLFIISVNSDYTIKIYSLDHKNINDHSKIIAKQYYTSLKYIMYMFGKSQEINEGGGR